MTLLPEVRHWRAEPVEESWETLIARWEAARDLLEATDPLREAVAS